MELIDARQAARAATRRLMLGLGLALALSAGGARAQDQTLMMASTTSTEQSGLFGHLLPRFQQATGIEVRVVAVGTGQALDIGRRGDADIVFVHNKAAEEKFVADGFSTARKDVMYNDFVLVGPKSDPAGVAGKDVAAALNKIATRGAPFVSRGDKSGTHAAELRLWKGAGVDIAAAKPAGYRECGCGMGPALNMASSTGAYLLTDRGTWISFKNRGDLAILVEGDTKLFNQYGVMVVNPARHPHVKAAAAQRFADWITSAAGQQAIADYKIGGEQLFFPNANAGN
ncbi:MAG: substrate-binding domain-containing protein [Rhodoferax sp.]|jgi:tungstate transport system substrate-binding protein|nr:substrate-binding domain-containing protein [Rhodoferax sp.]MCL4739221.1 substrate-binding domain-containing protein [Burkholderiaceae bacterium]